MKRRFKIITFAIFCLLTIIALLFCTKGTLREYFYYLALKFGSEERQIEAFKHLIDTEKGLRLGIEIAREGLKTDNVILKRAAISFLDGCIFSGIVSEEKKEGILTELIPILQDQDEQTASHAALLLGAIDSPSAIEPLINSLNSKGSTLRFCSLMALREYSPREYSAKIREIFEADSSETNRWVAATVLARMGDKTGYELLERYFQGDKDFYMIHSGCALIELGDYWAIPTVLQAIVAYDDKDKVSNIRRQEIIDTLEEVTGISYGNYNYKLSAEKKLEIITKWLNWWEENKDKLLWNPENQGHPLKVACQETNPLYPKIRKRILYQPPRSIPTKYPAPVISQDF